jgi:phytanoyl-CoA hydroxylase
VIDAPAFAEQGYVVARGLFGGDEASALCAHFMRLREAGEYPGDIVGADPSSGDPLRRYPPRLAQALAALLDNREPFAVQTMLYFKPPGARGQAPHQDQHYLRADPGTCVAAWMALDPCDEDNGCLEVLPGSHDWPILCTVSADTHVSFTDVTVPLPDDAELVPVPMEPGDVLFFNGSLVHGSKPNTSTRFRRALIGHYIQAEAREVAYWYHPVLRMDGTEAELDESLGGGEWADGTIQLTGYAVDPRTTE